MAGELLADRHALAVSQGAPRGGGSPSRPDFPPKGEAREGNAMPSRPHRYGLETSRARSAYARAAVAVQPKQWEGRKDPAAPTPLKRSGSCQLATRGNALARRLGLPKAKPTTRGAPL